MATQRPHRLTHNAAGMTQTRPMIRSKPTRNETFKTFGTAIALGLLVYGLIALGRGVGILQPYELLAYDLGLTIRQMQPAA